LFYVHGHRQKKRRKEGEAINELSPGALVSDERSIQVVVDRMLDGYSVTVLVTEGKLTRGLADATVATFDEGETIARQHAGENNFPWHKVAVICR
jgi:hypothetical protein